MFGAASPILAAMPMMIILSITAIKDGVEDLSRHRVDRELNNSITLTLQDGWCNMNHADRGGGLLGWLGLGRMYRDSRKVEDESSQLKFDDYPFDRPWGDSTTTTSGWKSTPWKDIKVGDFILLRSNDRVPADILVLAASEPDGVCYVETKSLDGETNLKSREALKETCWLRSAEECKRIKFVVESEQNTTNLYVYSGTIIFPVTIDDDSTGVVGGEWEFGCRVNGGGPVITNVNENDKGKPPAKDSVVPINIQNILLRGSFIRNTDFVIGLVLFTGRDTKVMLNAGATPSKRSKIERLMNPQVAINFLMLLFMCIVIACLQSSRMRHWLAIGAPWISQSETAKTSAFFTFWASVIMLQNIVPISLYITIEGVKTVQAYFIHTDVDMYDPETDKPCMTKTWNISDDLGQIEYIFSDKTGTLTQNKMEFRRCSIFGTAYGEGITDVTAEAEGLDAAARAIRMQQLSELMHTEMHAIYAPPYASPVLAFVDTTIFRDYQNDPHQADHIREFFTHLAVCHTVLAPKFEASSSSSSTTEIVYNAQSPDEQALVAGAKDAGFTFIGRAQDEVTVDVMGTVRKFRVLNILEFNSTRKRMSVVVRDEEGRIVLLCKGADSVIYERLALYQDDLRDITFSHLEQFANEGLRTLCIAQRTIPGKEYEQWSSMYQAASTALVDREGEIEKVAEFIERDLVLLGATAIEDKLQDQVPECIGLLREAGIKIWVLTGDKMETAINIGFASNLLSRDMSLIIIKGSDTASVGQQISEALQHFICPVATAAEADADKGRKRWFLPGMLKRPVQSTQPRPSTASHSAAFKRASIMHVEYGLVIDGDSLRYALENPGNRELFLRLGTRCKSVVCCRVSPKQKAQVVRLVQKGCKAMCLSIGDGANDVSMIQEANVGVGISGQEGLQAAMASDFVISQFKFLSKLVLVHGHWSYHRTSETVLNFFYKNMVWVFALFWYQMYCGFTADILYDYTYLMFYNLFFTSLPPLFLGIFDQDVSAEYALAVPQLYKIGMQQTRFTRTRFFLFVLDAVYQSIICFYAGYFFYEVEENSTGRSSDKKIMGTAVAMFVIVTVNIYVGLNIHNWTWMVFAVVFMSMASFIVYMPVWAQFQVSTVFHLEKRMYNSGGFWCAVVVVTTLCILPRIVTRAWKSSFHPDDLDIVRERQKYKIGPPPKTRKRRRSSVVKTKSWVDEEGREEMGGGLKGRKSLVSVREVVEGEEGGMDEQDGGQYALPLTPISPLPRSASPDGIRPPDIGTTHHRRHHRSFSTAQPPVYEAVRDSSPSSPIRVRRPRSAPLMPRLYPDDHRIHFHLPDTDAFSETGSILSHASIINMESHTTMPNTGFAFSGDESAVAHDVVNNFSSGGLVELAEDRRRFSMGSSKSLHL
ncbi:hypothetical protein HK104_005773, partial [Borealophlyctis nickersoniae]